MRFLACLVALLTIAAAGCNRKTPSPAGIGPSPEVPAVVENVGPALTDEECIQFAAKLEEAVYTNPAEAAGMLDKDAIVSRAADGLGLSPTFLKGFRTGFTGNSNNIFTRVATAVDHGDSYRFLRVHRKNGQLHVLFRMELTEGGLNYHDLLLARQADGNVRAVDLYIFVAGEYMTQLVHRMLLSLAAQEQRGLLDRLRGRDQDLVKYMDHLKRMSAAFQGGEFEEALQLFDQLPASLQNEKCFRLIQVRAASEVSSDIYKEAMEQYRTLFPDDPSCDLVLIDYYFLKKAFDDALHAIDALDKAVGGDPYLDTMRANVYSESGNLTSAKQFARKAVESDPKLKSAYWSLLTISLKEKDHVETAKLLNELSEKFSIQFNDLTKEESYKDFVKSPEFRERLEAREKK